MSQNNGQIIPSQLQEKITVKLKSVVADNVYM